MDFDKFCENFEAVRDTVCVDAETGAITADVKRSIDALRELQTSAQPMKTFRPMDFGRLRETHDMEEVHEKLEEIARFTQQMGGTVFDPKFGNSIFHRPKPVIVHRNRK